MNAPFVYERPGIYLILAAFLFAVGIYGLSGELIFSAAALTFMTLNRFMAPDPTVGQIFVLFIMGLAAAEVAIALSIIIAVYRNYRSIHTQELSELQG
jgi:NADH-quinone oxidoreductase subunit K